MTKIEWTDDVWSPTRGCSRVSEGCRHCYAERMASRFAGPRGPYFHVIRPNGGWNGRVVLVPEKLGEPPTWRKPRRVFVNSMSDLFHDAMSNEEIAAVFGVMASTPRHTYQVLTKRPARMVEWFKWAESLPTGPRGGAPVVGYLYEHAIRASCGSVNGFLDFFPPWPLPNVWPGVSVENRDHVDRIDLLRRTPAALRFLSLEPLLGPLDNLDLTGIGWVIAGCESGPGARPCDVAWLRSLRDQCAAAGVPFFLKQAKGSPQTYGTGGVRLRIFEDVTEGTGSTRKAGGIIGAPYLDGKQHLDFPEVP